MSIKATSRSESSKILGLITGVGGLPKAIASEAKKAGYRVVAIALQPPADESLKPFVDDFHKVHIGQFGRLISLLKKLSITEAIMAGKISKSLLFNYKKNITPDIKAIKLLFSLKDLSDDTIMRAIVKEFEKEGIKLLPTTTFLENLIATEGVLTHKKPTKNDLKDIEFGWKIAKEIGRLDIGQTVIVKDRAVISVEAIEGTDEAIKRAGDLTKDAIVIKVSKPEQDMRFDVPVVGMNTLYSMQRATARVLAVEAGKCIIVDKEEFIREANSAGIAVVGISNEKFQV